MLLKDHIKNKHKYYIFNLYNELNVVDFLLLSL